MDSIPVLSVDIRTIASNVCVLLIYCLGEQSCHVQPLALEDYGILQFIRYLLPLVARDGAFGYQCSNLRLLHSSGGVLVPLPSVFKTCVQAKIFYHLINRPAMDYGYAYVKF